MDGDQTDRVLPQQRIPVRKDFVVDNNEGDQPG